MPIVISSAKDLFQSRLGEVRDLIRPLRPEPTIHCQFYKFAQGGGKVLGVHDGKPPDTHFRDWHCQTFANSIWCQYYEWWRPFDRDRQWYLDRAYLHLFRTNRDNLELEQFLCIHSDPNCTDAEPLKTFKSGPHLHLIKTEPPLPDCHFPLNLGHLQAVLASKRNLTSALSDAIDVICKDVLTRYVQLQ